MTILSSITTSRSRWYSQMTRLLRFAFASLIVLLLSLTPHQVTTAQTGWQWYKTDLHVHSVLSADAYNDLGIMSQSAKSQGYNALFLTDHNLASSFPISSITANNLEFEDDYTRWTTATSGTSTSTTNALSSTPVSTGSKSLHLASTASGSGEAFVWSTRGPNFRSGDIILKFSVFPKRIDPGSGAYVSVSIGGDVTVQNPDGYTTSSGVISSGKSIVLVWQLGSARTASSDPNKRVLTYPLTYTLNTWNTYTINLSTALADIPSAELPLSYNAVTYVKMAAAGNGGTADAYFDTYSITPSAPVPPADEFVYRTTIIPTYNTSTFKIFPSLEMGISRHAQRFNFGITDPSQFVSYTNGIDGILPAQQSGYPSMLNHPGSSGGVSDQEAISTQGEGADLIEVRQQQWIDNWDAILKQGVQLLGTGTSDTHRVFSGSSYATYVYAPELTFDSLIRSIFEGRTYVAVGSFGNLGRVVFNLDSNSQDPYPARYPVYVSASQTSMNVHLIVTGGIKSGYTIRWIRNGAVLATDSTSGTTYEGTKSISLGAGSTYVRAEVRDSSGALKALTQPIIFVTVPGMPVDKNYHIDTITTADGRKYTKLSIKGITASGWDGTNQILTLTLQNPVNALLDVRLRSLTVPNSLQMDGKLISPADSLAAYQAASDSTWYYDSSGGLLYLKALQASSSSVVSIAFSNTPIPTPTIVSTSANTLTPTQTNGSAGLTFTPVADTYVQSDQPTNNFGASNQFVTDSSPVRNMFLKFTVSGVGSQAVTSAKLRIYCVDSSPVGGAFYRVADTTWNEGTVNWNTAPVADTNPLGTLGTVSAGNWYEINLSSLVMGDGTYSLKVNSTSADGAYYTTKEGTSGFAPQLILTTSTGSASTITPTATPTLTSTSSVSSTSTWTATSTSTSASTATPTGTAASTITSTATATPSQTSTQITSTSNPSGSITFTPVMDAYVKAANPDTNYGASTTLRTDNSPVIRSYLRFNVQNVPTAVKRATLRLFTNTGSSSGIIVNSLADNSWGELTVTYNNGPAVGNAIGTSGSVSSSSWATIDITPYITGNGTYNLVLTGASSTEISIASRETGANAPQLIIETGTGPAATPTLAMTSTSTASPTITPSSTVGPTSIATNTRTPTTAPTTAPTSTGVGTLSTFTPAADTYVNEASPGSNYGGLNSIRADASPIVRSYLRFDVQGLSGPVTRATLRIFTNSASSTGYEVRDLADNAWGELTVNYSNAPAVGSVTVTSGAFGSGTWITVDITPLITGNGTVSIALTTTNATAFSLASREAGANAPQLIVETSP